MYGKAQMGTQRILLVEDDPISLKLMRDVLRASGYETEEVTNGPDALVRASQSALDLIVMDIGLPGLDGVETARWLRNAPATLSIPIVAVTAYAMPGDEERIRSAGCDAYLTKPLRFAEFMTLVHTLLAAPVGNGG
jgi:two-component system, cell cycle response regulator DivK